MTEAKHSGSFDSYSFLWFSLGLFLLLIIVFLLPILPYDYWWYLRLGRQVLQTGAVPTVDTFSFTQAGKQIVYQSWLSGLIFWGVYAGGGVNLTFLLRALVIGLTYGLLWGLIRRVGTGPRLAAGLTLLAGLVGSNNWSVRPQMLAYPLFLAVLWILWEWQSGRSKTLWLLPLISVLWVNLHGSFVLLFALGVAALLFGRVEKTDLRYLGLCLGLALFASLLNPHGLGAWRYVFTSLTVPSNQIFSVEWRPPVNAGWQLNLFFAWLLLFAPLAALSSRKLSLLEWIWFLSFGWLALSGLRYEIWFTLIMAVCSAKLLADWDWRWLEGRGRVVVPALNYLLGGAFLLSTLALLPGVRARRWPQAPSPLSGNTPVAATQWLSQQPELSGPLFSDIAFSSYLIYALPSRPVWIDTRFELYPVEQWQRYQTISEAALGWENLLDEEGLNLLMISPTSQPHLVMALQDSQGWCQQYADHVALIFNRQTAGETCPEEFGGG